MNKGLIFLIIALVLVLLGGAGFYVMYTKTAQQQATTNEINQLDKTASEVNTKGFDDNSLNDIQQETTPTSTTDTVTPKTTTTTDLEADLKSLDTLGAQSGGTYSDTDLNDLK